MYLHRAYWAMLRAAISVMFQYRAEILLWAIWGLVNPAVLYAMWAAAAESQPNQMVAGYTRPELAGYYIAIMIIGHFGAAWDAYELGYHIRSGELSAALLRPILPIWNSLAVNVSYKVATLPFLLPMWFFFAWVVSPDIRPAGWQLALGCVAVVLGGVLNFLLGYLIALIAFWSPKIDALGEVYFGVGMFFGGRFSPIAALPGILIPAALVMPFRWMFAFPAELLIGKVTTLGAAMQGLAMQTAWVIGSAIAFRIAWSAAVRRFTAVSG